MPSIEEWRNVIGYEDHYEVSSFGNVRGKARVDSRGHSRASRPLTPVRVGRSGHQHYRVTFHKDGVRESIYLHRVVAMAFIDNPDGLPYVLHWDDDPGNNHVENLHWGTQEDNMREMSERGRHVSPNALKTECQFGHAFDEANTKWRKNGRRECRTCVNHKQREKYRLRRVA